MPLLPFLPAISSGLSSIGSAVGNMINRKETRRQNEADRNFQREMWDKTNDYNSPIKQMERLKAGGLNPNLVYGNGATTTASNPTPTASKPMPAPNTGEVMGSFFRDFLDLQQKQTQNDLMQTEIIAKNQQVAESKQRISNLQVDNTNKVYDSSIKDIVFRNKAMLYEKDKEMLPNTKDAERADTARKQLQVKELEIKNSFANEREQVAVYEAYARLKTASAYLKQSQVETATKEEILKLKKQGIEASDNVLFRIFNDILKPRENLNKLKFFLNQD